MCLPLAILGPVIGGAIAAGGSAVAGAVGSENARASQVDSATKAMQLQQQAMAQQQKNFDQTRADQAPWLSAGRASLADLLKQMESGSFNNTVTPASIANDPGYQFRMAEGQKALERSAAARGMTASGGAMKSLARYSQGLASEEYGNAWNRAESGNTNRFNRLASLAGVGQAAAQNLGSIGSQFSNQLGQGASSMGSLHGAIGNANAAGSMGMANAVSGAFGSLGNLFQAGMYANAMGQPQIPTQLSYGYGGAAPAYGQSSQGYATGGFGPWR